MTCALIVKTDRQDDMTKTEYNALQVLYQNTYARAWQYILDNWACQEWKALPHEIKAILKLNPSIGICNGMLVTKTGAAGLTEFITKMNRKRSD